MSQYVVTSDLLIPGKGEPIEGGCIVVDGKKLLKVSRTSELGKEYSHLPSQHVKILLPGLWDCHVHFAGLHKANSGAFLNSSLKMALTGARSARDVMLLLSSGFTSVREMAGYGIQLDEAIQEGTLVGPKIYSSNSIISPTGGHGDLHDLPKHWHEEACCHGLPFATCDGVPECLKTVRKQLRVGASVIKICTSGGVTTEMDNAIDQQFSEEEITAMVEEAARSRRIVGAHCHGKLGIMVALRCGVKTIEHGSYLDEEVANLMLEKDAVLVCTRLIIENSLQLKDYLSPVGAAKLIEVAAAHSNAMKLAVKMNVKMALGTDMAGTIPKNKLVTFGANARELIYLVQAGMTPLQAIEAATANGPLTLGPQAPLSGQLQEGYDADFIGLDENPLENIESLANPDHVTHVWRQGVCYKSPGNPVTCL